jgi:two-component system, NtrC family, response regulator AtoC
MAHESQRVLVVDDLPDWRSTLRGLLGDAGYKVETAESLSGAIRLLELRSFDLALIDMRLDETDEDNTSGLDLAEEIRHHWPLTKIITITGYGTTERLRRAMEPNSQGSSLADEYIPKTQTEDLIRVIQRVLVQ